MRTLGLFLFTAAFLCAPAAHAATLSAVADVRIEAPVITQNTNGTYAVAFSAKNNADTATDAVFGVRIQNSNNESVYATTNDAPVTIGPRAAANGAVIFTLPPQSDTYTIFATVGSVGGVSLAARAVDTLVQEAAPAEFVRVTECTYADGEVVCQGENLSVIETVSYDVLKGGAQGVTVTSGSVRPQITEEDFSFTLETSTLVAGRYVGALTFEGAEEALATAEFFFNIQGDWLSFDVVSIDDTSNVFTARAYVSGEHDAGEWGLLYWVLDSSGAVCAHENQRFGDRLTREYMIVEQLANCVAPQLVAFAHVGKNNDDSYRITDTYGDADFSTLATESSSVTKTSSAEQSLASIGMRGWAGILLFIAGLLVAVLYVFRSHSTVAVIALFVFFSAAQTVNAATFVSGNEVFTVTLDSTTYSSTETIDFTFGIEDSTTGAKPVGDRVLVRVDDGAYTEIVDITDTATLYSVSLPAVADAGTHTLEFLAPGHFFGAAIFGLSRFGIDDREFSVDFTIEANTAPNPPTVSGSCTIGATNTYYVQSTDPQGDALYYGVRINEDVSATRVPVSGTVASGVQQSVTRVRETAGSDVVNAYAIDAQGLSSTTTVQTVPCTTPCAHCTYDGGSYDITLVAQPSLVLPGQTTNLSWELENVTDCSINGTNGDAWDWDTVSSVQSVTSASVTGPTTFTMTCTEVGAGEVSESVTVGPAPIFEEF